MFKKIPGSLDYQINLRKEIIDQFGNVLSVNLERDKKFEIVLFGKTKRVSLDWLSLLAWYECGSIENLDEHLDKIRFYPAISSLRIRCGHVMAFTEPVYYKEGFRYIPCFSRYAISIDGVVLDTLTNQSITERRIDHEYICVYLRNPDRCANRDTREHRLIGLAWLPNTDFLNKPFINHIDGKRINNSPLNLEWCSSSENSIHAYETGLNPCQVKMKSRDVKTGEIEVYSSTAELFRKLGLSRGYSSLSFSDRLPGQLYKNRYEVKTLDDDSPWFYEQTEYNPDEQSKAYFTITVLNKENGEVKVFHNGKKFFRAYGLWMKSDKIEDGIALFKERYKTHDVSFKRNTTVGPYRVVDIVEGRMVIFSSIKKASEHIGLNINEITHDLKRSKKFVYGKRWVVVSGIDEIVLSDYRDKPKPYTKVLIVNAVTGNERIANSLKHAKALTGVVARTIKKSMQYGGMVKGLYFRPVE